ncbi:tetratricopeptide repeat protein [Massilia sp. DWR3-1-1]|uniref:tetratricopeptide repeat protein n=1 Tax=Massilia sp. DWR3-1-1 TaxID=2804559 RepID=UPI003CF35D52
MTIFRIFPALACAALLSACAGPAATPGSKLASMDSILSEADAAAKAGRPDQAYAMLRTAAASNPADKTPLLRIAQMRFDDKNYGEAIVSGLQALERDPNDMLAYSLVAVSGLRVSSKALGDLSQKNGFTGSVRTEAQDLAALLRNTLKEPIVVPTGPRAAPARPATPATPASTVKPASTASTVKPPCTNPFCGLN